MNKPVIIDGGFISAQARFSLGFAQTTDGIKTGIVFGILYRLLSLSQFLHSNQFIFTWDSKHSLRKKMYPSYKGNRHNKMNPEEWEEFLLFKEQVTSFRKKVLARLGFRNTFIQNGYEADDLIASICKDVGPCFVFSADSDLYQLLNPSVTMVIPNKGREKYRLFSQGDFEKKYGISPAKWWRIKALAGCSSDNVKGIHGIGELTAIKYVSGQLVRGAKYDLIRNNLRTYTRNVPLVRLPFKNVKKFKIRRDRLDYDSFVDLCKEYQLYSFLDGRSKMEWLSFFKDAKGDIRRSLNAKRKSKGLCF